jgi:catechol 2,3-dioxygenase-like lactoylglutathione lyase family enzyme
MKLKRAIPTMRIYDVDKTREFYIDYLGFTLDFEHRFHDGAPLFMRVSRDGVAFYLSEHHGDGPPGVHVNVEIDDVDAYHAELHSRPYKFMNPGIQDQEWGRDMMVVDPFNNRIYFTQRKE